MSVNIFLSRDYPLCLTLYLNDPLNCSELIQIKALANNSSLYPNSPKFGPNTYRTPHQQLVLRLLQRPWSLQILSVEPSFLTGVEQLQRHLVKKLNVTKFLWPGNIFFIHLGNFFNAILRIPLSPFIVGGRGNICVFLAALYCFCSGLNGD